MKTNRTLFRPWAGSFWSFGLHAIAGALLLALGVSPGLQALPVIVTQPTDLTICEGDDAKFCVVAESQLPLTYQWRWHTTGLIYTNIPYATEACLTLAQQPGLTNLPRMAVVVSDTSGSVTSSFAKLTVRFRVRITRQPSDFSVPTGETATFSVEATGTAPRYQWYLNNQAMAGWTTDSLTVSRVQAGNEGDYHVVISNVCGTVTSQTARLRLVRATTFTQILTGPLVTDLGNASIGGHTGDYDGDGYLDVFVSRFLSTPSSLYHNNRDGTFRSVTNSIFPVSVYDTGGIWADFDNDGQSDLFVFNWQVALTPSYFVFPNVDGSFTKVVFEPQSPGGVSALDLNQDGLLDLCVFRGDAILTNRLYRNVNGRSFQPFSKAEVGALLETAIWGGGWADYDDDGAMDLFTASGGVGVAGCKLYRNDGHGRFTTVTNRIILDGLVTGQRAAVWGDYDNDGRVDLCIAESDPSANGVLYRNLGAGQFERTSAGLGIPAAFLLSWVDYDNDGFLDLYASPVGRGLALFRNGGNGTFARITKGTIVTNVPPEPNSSSSGNWFDYDNDGFLDLLVGNGTCCSQTMVPNYLYHNDGNSNAWLKVKLVGTVSNRDAVGAKVRVKATYAGATRWQRRDITAGEVFLGNNKPLAHFGLGDATIAETVRVEWPSGQVTELHDVAVRQHLTITEAPGLRTTGLTQGTMPLQITAHPGMNIQLKVASDIGDSGTPLMTRPQTNRTDTVIVPDDGRQPQRFYKVRVQ